MRTLALLAVVAGCGSDSVGDLFADEGTPSTSAAELMAKDDQYLTPGISGVYEKSGEVFGQYTETDGYKYNVYNNFVVRRELRATKLVTAMQCVLSYHGTSRPNKTLTVFSEQEAVAYDDYYAIASGSAEQETDPVSMSRCSIEQATAAWDYCEENGKGSGIYNKVPAGSTMCVGRQGLGLYLEPGHTGEFTLGDKVAN